MTRAPDKTDRSILSALQRHGRLTNLELAERVNLSPSPCLRRVRALEATGLIEGYEARLNRRQLGLDVLVFVFAAIERHATADSKAVRKAINDLPEVVECHVITGEFDLLLKVALPDLDAYRTFSLERLLRVPGIRDIRTSMVIDTVVDTRPLPLLHIR